MPVMLPPCNPECAESELFPFFQKLAVKLATIRVLRSRASDLPVAVFSVSGA